MRSASAARATEPTSTSEFRVVWPDGSVHWVDDKARAFFDENGKPLYMTGACADITSRKEAAETLRENEERLRAIFNQAAVGIAVATLDGRFLDMNKRFSEILGYSPDELRDLTFTSITHPDDLTLTPRPRWASCSRGPSPSTRSRNATCAGTARPCGA